MFDFSKLKKAPVPASSDAVLYYRGGGAKVSIFADRMKVTTGTGTFTRAGDYTDKKLAEIRDLATAMLANASRKSEKVAERPVEVTHSIDAPQGSPDFYGDGMWTSIAQAKAGNVVPGDVAIKRVRGRGILNFLFRSRNL